MKKGNSDPITADLQAQLKALEALPDSEIDVIDWFESSGSGYQTRINAALREFVSRQQTRT